MEVSTTQAAAMVGRSERSIQRWIATGKLKAHKLPDGRYLVEVNELEKVRGADHADIEALLQRVDALETAVAQLAQTVSELQSTLAALSAGTKPYEVKTPPVRILRESAGPSTALPSGLVALSEMVKRHGVPETSVRRAVSSGALPVVVGNWPGGVKQAIDAEGHAKFYALYHERPGFERCEACPHL